MGTYETLKRAYCKSTGKDEPEVLATLGFGAMSGSIGAASVYREYQIYFFFLDVIFNFMRYYQSTNTDQYQLLIYYVLDFKHLDHQVILNSILGSEMS